MTDDQSRTDTDSDPPSAGRRARLRSRVSGLPVWVRWPAATLLALALILGIGVGGFAVGSELSGHNDGHGDRAGRHDADGAQDSAKHGSDDRHGGKSGEGSNEQTPDR